MKRTVIGPDGLEERLDCFGRFDLRDTICLKWCLFNIRCAIVRNRDEELEIIEDLVDLVVEPFGLQ